MEKNDIRLLKGVKLNDFKNQNNISKIIAKEFLKSNKKIVSSCLICNSKKRKIVAKVFKIPFFNVLNAHMFIISLSMMKTF